MKQVLFSTFLFCFTFLIVSPFVRSQNYIEYHKLCDEAAKQIEMGLLLPAQGMLMHAFSLVPEPKAIDLFHMAKCWSQNENEDSTWHYLERALSMNPRIGKLTRIHYPWFEPVFGIARWEEIKKSTEKFTGKEKTLEEEMIFSELVEIYSIFFEHRQTNSRDSRVVTEDSLETKKLWEQIEVDDSIATIRFEKFADSTPNLDVSHFEIAKILTEILNLISIDYIDTHQEWFYEQLKRGNVDPKFYIDMFHSKQWQKGQRNEKGVYYINSYFYDSTIEPEEAILIEKFGCFPDYKIVTLRYSYSWPYD